MRVQIKSEDCLIFTINERAVTFVINVCTVAVIRALSTKPENKKRINTVLKDKKSPLFTSMALLWREKIQAVPV